MRNEATLVTQGQAAEVLGVHAHTVGDLVKAWGLEPKAMSNGRARGLDARDMRVLRRALNQTAKREAVA